MGEKNDDKELSSMLTTQEILDSIKINKNSIDNIKEILENENLIKEKDSNQVPDEVLELIDLNNQLNNELYEVVVKVDNLLKNKLKKINKKLNRYRKYIKWRNNVR